MNRFTEYTVAAGSSTRIRAADRATYPDLHVVCAAVEADPEDRVAVVNPTVIAEVLSDGTEDSDRGDKFLAYSRLRTLREYVVVSQHERRIYVYTRDGRRWVIEEPPPYKSRLQ